MIQGQFKFTSTSDNIEISDVIINDSGEETYPVKNEDFNISSSTSLKFDRLSDFYNETILASYRTTEIYDNDGLINILDYNSNSSQYELTGTILQNTQNYNLVDINIDQNLTSSNWALFYKNRFIWGLNAKLSNDKNFLVVGGYSNSYSHTADSVALLEIYQRQADNSWLNIKKISYRMLGHREKFFIELIKATNTIVLFYRGKRITRATIRIYEQNQGGTNNWGQVYVNTDIIGSTGSNFTSFGDWLAISRAKSDNSSLISIFHRDTGGTNQWNYIDDNISNLINPAQFFGRDLHLIDDSTLIVSHKEDNRTDSIFYYKRTGNAWNLEQEYFLPQEFLIVGEINGFGYNLTGVTVGNIKTLFVGAIFHNENRGRIYKFELNTARTDAKFVLMEIIELENGNVDEEFSRQLYFNNNLLFVKSYKNGDSLHAFNISTTDIYFTNLSMSKLTNNGLTEYVINYEFMDNLSPTSGLKINNNSNPITITDFDNIPLVKTGEQFKFFNGEITSPPLSVPTIRDGTSLQSIFEDSNITNLNATNWDTSKVTNISEIFKNCNSLVSLNLSSWDTSIVTNMSSAFKNCKKLESLDINNWSTGLVENFSSMFENCLLLTPDLINFTFSSNITNINKMITNCKLPASQYSSFLRKLADSDMPKDLTLGYTGHVRLDNSQTNAAYTKLVSDDTTGYNLTFTDGGSYTQEEISKFTSDPLPNDLIIMNSSTNGTEINISNTMYISDLGGIEHFPVHFSTMYSLTINLPQNDRIELTGIVDMISPDFFKIFDGGDNNATLIYNSLDTSNQNLNLTSSGKKLHFQLSLDDNTSGSGIFIKVMLLDNPNINNIIATWGSILDIPEIQSNQEVEIRTSNINDNTQIELTILNSNGQSVITRSGTITSNIATILFNKDDNPFDNLDTGKYTFKASLNYEGSNILKEGIEFDIDKNLPVIGNFTYKWGNDSNILDESNKELDGSLNITFSNIINNSTYELFINDTKIADGTISDSNTNNLDIVISKSVIGNIDKYYNQIKFILRNNNNTSEKIDNFFAHFLQELPICFLENAIVHTDQGKIEICKLNSNYSINGLKIIKITKFLNKDDHMILFKKHSIGMNKPCVDTPVSRLHGIFINDFNMIPAYKLINNRNIFRIKIGKKYIYNVLLKYHSKMLVNNMLVETLNPENKIAKLYINQYKNQSKIAFEKKTKEGCIIS